MVKIRLALRGKKKNPFFHIVAVDSQKKRDGMVLELLGTYNPAAAKSEEKVKINLDLYKSWMAKGAKPTETVAQIVRFGK